MIYRLGRRTLDRRRGVVTVTVAVALVAILGVVALTADGGLAMSERRNAQAAADAAAMSGAADLFTNWQSNGGYDTGSAAANAKTCAEVQGYSASDITVNVPGGTYAGGPNKGTTIPAGYVEVIIQYSQPPSFSAIFSSDSIVTSARSVAMSYWVFAPPIVVLDPSATRALLLTGNGKVDVPNGAVFVNSTDASALYNSAGGQMRAPQYNVVGGTFGGNFNAYPGTAGTVQTGTRPIADPLQYIPTTFLNSLASQTKPPAQAGNVYTLSPGHYVGGLAFNGASDTVNMAPGIYYMDGGGFKFKGAVLNAPSVMIYNGGTTPGSISISGNGSVVLRPLPSSYGIAQGITIFQDRTATPTVILSHSSGLNTWEIRGVIYAANAKIATSKWNGDPSFGEQFISRLLSFGGTGDMTVPGNFVKSRGVAGVE